MELPFIYKYQPLYLKDFEIPENLFMLINTFINMDTLNILFIGNSGCGKTSLINAIIKEYYINENPDNVQHNIMYINNLKEQGISYYRNEVKTFCQTGSTINGKKKILVLDDMDVINEQSQQTFRNFIDKYSHNVHFISSCINTQKIIDSIQSRMIMVKIKSLTRDNLSKILQKISRIENINIENDAQQFVLSISNQSVRVLINYLEKFKLIGNTITLKLAITLCTNISFDTFVKYTELCKKNKIYESITILNALYDEGYSVIDILDNYFLFVKITDILNDNEKYDIFPLVCKYISIFHNIHEDKIELALFTNNLIQKISYINIDDKSTI